MTHFFIYLFTGTGKSHVIVHMVIRMLYKYFRAHGKFPRILVTLFVILKTLLNLIIFKFDKGCSSFQLCGR